MEMLKDVLSFGIALLKTWSGYVTGGIIIAGFWLWGLIKNQPMSSHAGLLIASFSLLIAGFSVWRNERSSKLKALKEVMSLRTNDHIALNRPYLEAVVVIEQVKSKNVVYHFEIENRGNVTASGILLREFGPDHLYIENDRTQPRILAPKAKMLADLGGSLNAITGIYFVPALQINYTANLGGLDQRFQSLFKFALLMESIKSGTFTYRSSEFGPPPDAGIDKKHMEEGLNIEAGTMHLVIPETNNNGASNRIMFSGHNRRLIFDGVERFVSFSSVKKDNKPVELRLDIKSKIDTHRIWIAWSGDGAFLRLDEESISTPNGFQPAHTIV